MELLVVGAVVGIVLALALARVIWIVIGQAVDNLIAWAVYTFGNDEAVKRQKEADDRRARSSIHNGPMDQQPPLSGILETVLYCDSSNEEAVRHFYREVMGFQPMDFDFGYRVGNEGHVFLVFNSDNTQHQERPPAHGATGKGHCCFTADKATYENWKTYLEQHNVAWGGEITWGNGMRSFYFEDPAGNVLEIAEGDFWPVTRKPE